MAKNTIQLIDQSINRISGPKRQIVIDLRMYACIRLLHELQWVSIYPAAVFALGNSQSNIHERSET